MILLWGLEEDTPLAAVRKVLCQLGAPVTFINQRTVLDTEIELRVSDTVEGYVSINAQVIDLSSITAAYMRPHDTLRLPAVKHAGCGSAAWQHAVSVDDALLSWAELTPALVINRPAAMASNNSKPYQAIHIQSFGFAIPDTLLTTDPKAVREFLNRHGTVIYKSISGVRSIVSRLGLNQAEHLEDVTWCPTQFQQYIAGNDYRVHVVGEEVFACEIMSVADDYRYASRHGITVEIRPYPLPKDVADRCKALAKSMELCVVGVDLRCTPEGRWYCFEVNPSPAFTYFQDASGQVIDEAIARLLLTSSSFLIEQ
jgi:RimK-like ATP-grasp domain